MKKTNISLLSAFWISFNMILPFMVKAQSNFVPTDITGLSLWLSADSLITVNVDSVIQWNDISGLGNNASQVTDVARPKYIPNLLNSKPAIRFDGSNDFMQIPDNPTFDFISGMTIFIVAKQQTLALDKCLLSKWDYSSQGSWAFQTDFSSSNELGMFVADALTDAGNNTVSSLNAVLTNAEFSITSIVYDGSQLNNNRIKFYKNMALLSSSTGGTIATSMQNSTASIKIGRFGGLGRAYNGDIAEIIMYDKSLTAVELDSVGTYLHRKYAPPINLGPDTLICSADFPITIRAKRDYLVNYLWQDGSTLDSIIVNSAGAYIVNVKDQFGFFSKDTINVILKDPQPLQLNDTTFCQGSTLTWNTSLSHAQYTFSWQDASADSLFNITSPGQYYVSVSDLSGCIMTTNTVTVTMDNFPTLASLGLDNTLCVGNSIFLTSGAAQAVSYTWSDGSTNDSLTILVAGQYSLTATSTNGCIKKDTINIAIAGSAPTVAFSISTACEGTANVFTDASSPPGGNSITSRNWDFGDLSLGTGLTPSHTYADSGSYTAKLTITTDVGCTGELSKTFTVYPHPQGSFTIANLCERDSVLFTASAINDGYPITQWGWSFGEPTAGPGFQSMIQNPKHYYASAATYTVSLTIQNAFGCATTVNNSITIKPSPVTDFNYSLLCEKEAIVFTDNTPIIGVSGGSWDFGDGSAVSPIISPTHTYSVSGTYNVAHTMTYTNTCSNTMTKVLTIQPKPIALYATGNACVSAPINFTDTSLISSGSITAWRWTFGAGGPTSILQNAQYTFNAPVSPQIKLKVTSDQGCVDSITKTIIVRPLPVADFTYSPNNGSPPLAVTFTNTSTGAVSYAWDFGDTNTDNQTNTANTFVNTGTYNVSLIATSSFGCVDTTIKIVDALDPHIDVAVQNVTAVLNNNFLTITAQIVNKGTVDVTSLILTIRLNDGTIIQENWTGLLLRGGVILDTISSTIYLKDIKHFVCVSAAKPNNLDDEVPSDNESCIATDKSSFEVLDPYPVPAGESITLAVLIPNSTSNLEVDICNARGKTLRPIYSGTIGEGLQLFKIDLTGVAHGFYAFMVTYEGKTVVKKFIVD